MESKIFCLSLTHPPNTKYIFIFCVCKIYIHILCILCLPTKAILAIANAVRKRNMIMQKWNEEQNMESKIFCLSLTHPPNTKYIFIFCVCKIYIHILCILCLPTKAILAIANAVRKRNMIMQKWNDWPCPLSKHLGFILFSYTMPKIHGTF